jgi:hypothetical protein
MFIQLKPSPIRQGCDMKWIFGLFAIIVTVACSQTAYSDTRVTVGVYHFPPAAVVTDAKKISGLLGQILDELNARQSDYTFVPYITSSQGRHRDFIHGRYDVIFFESPKWSWGGIEHQATHPLLKDEEVYLALKKPGRDQSFFNHLHIRRIVAMLGYHYDFADYETDGDILRQRFDIELSHSHRRNIDLILADRPDIAEITVVGRSYLQLFLKKIRSLHIVFWSQRQ